MTLRRLNRWMVAGGFAAVLTSPVQAQVRNTGTGGGLTDPFWSVDWSFAGGSGSVCSSSPAPDCALYTPSEGFQDNATVITSPPSPPWAPNNATSRWIGRSATGNQPYSPGGAGPGDNARRFAYIFTTDLLGTGNITGTLGWDNRLFGYAFSGVGGVPIGDIVAPNATWLSPTPSGDMLSGFCRDGDGVLPSSSFPDGCLASMNIAHVTGATSISFFVIGDGATDGFRVAGTPVPEPSSAVLLGAGLMAMGGMMRRKRRGHIANDRR